jgi:hypothetical protein
MMKPITASFILIGALMFLAVWKYAALDGASTPALGIIIALYLIISLRSRHQSQEKKEAGITNTIVPVFLLVLVAGILIIGNGGILSPLFFVFSFLCFAIAFTLPPQSVFIFTIGIILLFFSDALSENLMQNMTHFGSLILLTPIAFYFGKEFQMRAKRNAENQETADRIRREAATVLRDNQNMSEDNKVQLADIIHESDELRKD